MIPSICLSRSLLKNFLIFFSIKRDIKNISGIAIIVPIPLVINS